MFLRANGGYSSQKKVWKNNELNYLLFIVQQIVFSLTEEHGVATSGESYFENPLKMQANKQN
jgi:hypothetical protein